MRKLLVGCVALALLAVWAPAAHADADIAHLMNVSARASTSGFTVRAVAQDNGGAFATVVIFDDSQARNRFITYPVADGQLVTWPMECQARVPPAPANSYSFWTGPDWPACEYYDLPYGSFAATTESFAFLTASVTLTVCATPMSQISAYTNGDCRTLTVTPNSTQIVN